MHDPKYGRIEDKDRHINETNQRHEDLEAIEGILFYNVDYRKADSTNYEYYSNPKKSSHFSISDAFCLYLDNGKAFKSKLFHEKWKEHDLEKELGGVYPRLGVQAKFAKDYNARGKGPIERFFRTMQEDFERFISTWRGANIVDKPAYLSRNEELHRKIKVRKPLTWIEAEQLISLYIYEFYGHEPHSGLNGRCPLDVLKKAQIPQDRIITLDRLNFLMLKVENRVVGKEGINYMAECQIDPLGVKQ